MIHSQQKNSLLSSQISNINVENEKVMFFFSRTCFLYFDRAKEFSPDSSTVLLFELAVPSLAVAAAATLNASGI